MKIHTSYLLATLCLLIFPTYSCKQADFKGSRKIQPAVTDSSLDPNFNPNTPNFNPNNPNTPILDPNNPNNPDNPSTPNNNNNNSDIFTSSDSSDPDITSGADTAPIDPNRLTNDTFNGPHQVRYSVDIIFLLDHSPSMSPRIASTMQNLQLLITQYLQTVTGLDYRIFLIGKGSAINFNFNDPKVARVNAYVGSHSALVVAQQFLLGQIRANSNIQVRPESVKELVVVSDDDAEGVTAATFLNWLVANQNVAQDLHVNGIIAKFGKCGLLTSSKVGQQYINLAIHPRTFGITEHICNNTPAVWKNIFVNLGTRLRELKAAPQSYFRLQSQPTNLSKMRVFVNNQQVLNKFWDYLANRNEVVVKRPLSNNDIVNIRYER